MKEGLSDGASSSTATWTMYHTFSMGERSGELGGQCFKISFIRLLRKKNVPFGRLETPPSEAICKPHFATYAFFNWKCGIRKAVEEGGGARPKAEGGAFLPQRRRLPRVGSSKES